MALYLAVIVDGLLHVLGDDFVAFCLQLVQDRVDLAALGCSKVFAVGAGIRDVAGLVQILHDGKALLGGHLEFLAQDALELGERIQFTGLNGLALCGDVLDGGAGKIIGLALALCQAALAVFKGLFAGELDLLAVGLGFGDEAPVFLGDKVANGHIAVIDGLDDGDDDAADTEQRAAFEGGKTSQVHAIEPVDVGSGVALVCQGVVAAVVFQIPEAGHDGLGRLIWHPQALNRLGVLRLTQNDADDDLTFAV